MISFNPWFPSLIFAITPSDSNIFYKFDLYNPFRLQYFFFLFRRNNPHPPSLFNLLYLSIQIWFLWFFLRHRRYSLLASWLGNVDRLSRQNGFLCFWRRLFKFWSSDLVGSWFFAVRRELWNGTHLKIFVFWSDFISLSPLPLFV